MQAFYVRYANIFIWLLMSLAAGAQKRLTPVVRLAHIIGMSMMLAEWMEANEVSDEALAADLGIDRSTVSRVRRAKLLPSSTLIAQLVQRSGGAIDPRTFFRAPYPMAPSEPEAAAE